MTWNESSHNYTPTHNRTVGSLVTILQRHSEADGRLMVPVQLGLLRRIADWLEELPETGIIAWPAGEPTPRGSF